MVQFLHKTTVAEITRTVRCSRTAIWTGIKLLSKTGFSRILPAIPSRKLRK
ncbi:MAG TPA: hypothetical protein DHW15_10530 [Bacteroidetes bacterium]|nr:hypothetical protein [Bacteroidota bacterium]